MGSLSTQTFKMLMSFDFRPLVLLLAGALLAAAGPACGAAIAVVAPKVGPYDLLGRQIREGAEAAARKLGVEIALIDETCEAGSGGAIAAALKAAGAQISIGYLCSESLDGALPALKTAGIPAITVSVRAPIIMEDALKFGWPLYRLAPSRDAESEKLAEVILRDWQASAFAMVEDGTIRARELVENLRDRLEARGLKPAFLDTYRPGQEQQVALVRRLRKAGVTHLFVGGDRNDAAIIARDAASEAIPLDVLGGDALQAANQPVPLADGVRAVALPPYATLPSAADAVTRLRAAGAEPDGYTLPAYAAVEIAAQSVAAGQQALALAGHRFETALGTITFNGAHELSANPYRLVEWRGTGFVLVDGR